MERIYVMKCGCIIWRSDKIFKSEKHKTCPIHSLGIDYIVTWCEACGKKLILKACRRRFCDECNKRKLRVRDAQNTRNWRAKQSKIKKLKDEKKRKLAIAASVNCWNCKYRIQCLNTYEDRECLPCLSCNRYRCLNK